MDPNQIDMQAAMPQKHFRAFWPILIVAVLSALVGGLIVWAAYNSGLDDELNSLLPGGDKNLTHKQKNIQLEQKKAQPSPTQTTPTIVPKK